MANQAIALQARAPQGNFLAPAIQQGAQMINMMSQQRAAERQAAVQQQQLEIARAAEGRAVAEEGRKGKDFELKREADLYVKYRRLAPVVAEGGPAAYASYLQNMSVDSPESAAAFQQTMPVDKFDKDTFTRMIMGADEYAAARYGKAITKEFITPEGDVMGANISGFPGATYATPVPDISRPVAPAAPTAPAAAAPAPATGGMFQPISATGGQPQGADPQAALLASLNEARQTGQIGADVVEQLRQLGGPQAAPRVDAFLAQNNIKVAPGGMQSAVYRPEGGAPLAQQVNYDPNAFAPLRAKSPMQSPVPGSAIVPLTRVREEAAAGRQTPAEAAAVASATATATKAAELKAEQAKKLPAKRQVSSLLQKLRNAYETLNTAEAIPSSERGAFANVFDYLSTTGAGREVQRALGTAANKPLNEITGARKLLATAIKNATGMSAQEMNSNVELQLTLDALTDPTQGYESAISQLDTLEQLYGTGGAQTPPPSNVAPQKTPVAKPPAGISADDWKFMTPEERRLWQK
jgi:hypothetical protein